MSHGGLRSVACEACRAFCAVATVIFFTISALRALQRIVRDCADSFTVSRSSRWEVSKILYCSELSCVFSLPARGADSSAISARTPYSGGNLDKANRGGAAKLPHHPQPPRAGSSVRFANAADDGVVTRHHFAFVKYLFRFSWP